MNTFRNLGLTLLGLVIITSACKKENPTPSNPTPQPTTSLNNFFVANVANAIQTFTIDAQSTQTITGNKGTTLTFYANSFQLPNGSIAQGNVRIELIEIYQKKDMILLNKPTLGNQLNGGMSPLISGGEFRIQAFQGQQELSLVLGYMLQAPAPNGTSQEMSGFIGNDSGDVFTWDPMDSSSVWIEGNNYIAYFGDLGWINLDYFMSSSDPQTSLQVQVQEGLDNSNCALFISFDGLNAITTLWNFENGVFSTGNYYAIPVGQAVHFIALSFAGMIPHFAIVGNTIENNHLQVMPTLTATTAQNLENDLSNLP
jgi:hypothetical protein